MNFDFFKKKTKEPIYLESDFKRFSGDLEKAFEIHGQLEQKIIMRAVELKTSENKLCDYITLSKMIDKQILFLNQLAQPEQKSIIERIIGLLKRNE